MGLYKLSQAVYPLLFGVLSEKRCRIKKIGDILVEHLDYQRFRIAFANLLDRQSKAKNKKQHSNKISESRSYLGMPHTKEKDENLYDKFEYGLSDW